MKKKPGAKPKREYTWVVVRHGSNAANQSMTPRAVVGTVTATNRVDAYAKAAQKFTAYSNQHIELIPESRANKEDARVAFEEDVLDEEARAERLEILRDAAQEQS